MTLETAADAPAAPAGCPHCDGFHHMPEMATQWVRYGEGYRDGMAGRYAPRSDAYAAAGYDAGNCAGFYDSGRDVLYARPADTPGR